MSAASFLHSSFLQATVGQTVSVNTFLKADGKSRARENLFSKYFVNVNVKLNFKKEMCIPLKPIPKEDTLRR